MRSRSQDGIWQEKASSGWWNGCNSAKVPWLMPDTQYRWGVNIVNRGGIPQTRPGYLMQLTLPSGNLQGMKIYTPTIEGATSGKSLVFAVDGKIYAAPFPLTQPPNNNWTPFQVPNIQFNPNAQFIYWAVAAKSVQGTTSGTLQIVPTYSVLIMQDGGTAAAFWDGLNSRHLNENAPNLETPRGTWMQFTGGRLWVSRDNLVLASDLEDPLSFKERISGATQGDFKVSSEITGMTESVGSQRTSNLVVFTESDTTEFQSSITDRTLWSSTAGFQTVLFSNLGCVAGRSIVNHSGLLWWYSRGGLVSSDSAAQGFITSQISFRDIEMANSKRNFAPDLSGICGASFENYLLESVPSGDPLNSQTMVLDYAIANELFERQPPAWNGVWTGTRPVEWDRDIIEGVERIFHASIDYQSLNGSFNHIWEAFQADRMDTYNLIDQFNTVTVLKNQIYCSFESKLLGDGLDIKKFKFAEIDLVEIGGIVNLKVSYGGNKGGYHQILSKKIIATLDTSGENSTELQQLFDRQAPFRVQTRRVITSEAEVDNSNCGSVESELPESYDKNFGLYIQWCGRMGIEAFRFFTEPHAETSVGSCETDETGINVLTQDGTSFKL